MPLVVGTSVTVDKTFVPGSSVVIKGSCDGTDVGVGMQLQLNGNTIWFGQEQTAQKDFTHTFMNLQKGSYSISTACNNENSVKKSFCVGTDADCGVVVGGGDQSGSSSSSSSSSSGGGGCTSKWDCDVWTQCNTTLQQSRVCYDLNKCKKPSIENRTCTPCLESWVCSAWGECNSGMQVRKCYDEHDCGTGVNVPKEKKQCDDMTDYGYAPALSSGGGEESSFVSSTSENVLVPPSAASLQKPVAESKKDYTFYYIGIPSLLLLLIVLFIVLYHFFHKPKHVVINYDELKGWIKKELDAGESVDDIRKILKENTGWTDEELQHAFGELSSTSSLQRSTEQTTNSEISKP